MLVHSQNEMSPVPVVRMVCSHVDCECVMLPLRADFLPVPMACRSSAAWVQLAFPPLVLPVGGNAAPSKLSEPTPEMKTSSSQWQSSPSETE